jgi:quercetin dioxygenase-like cupin family protein
MTSTTGSAEPATATAEVARLTDLVQYQDGSIVSRTLVKRGSGSVTVFAFAAGQAISEHTVPHDALVLVVDGEAEVTVGGRMHRLRSGDTIVMPAGQPHAVKAATRFKMLLTMLRA